jgi:hypothetical protein
MSKPKPQAEQRYSNKQEQAGEVAPKEPDLSRHNQP